MREISVTINSCGQAVGIYDDALREVFSALGNELKIERASYVEPTEDGQWTADMSPVQPGVVLGPFKLRSEALRAEEAWLREHLNF